ncbi:hypothetical protein A3I18_02485 [Candidatus Campbellbacteria bacterium RIFCSPLOWO2_02_FULL_35_11]|uniref:Serine protease n=2 Tax=Candidatus Campbelliibacteriota TaxID=1752727 RepID=A0A1F5EKW2_9BACT|nr:MAG: hypothetical protein A3E89_02770 [Candidatus Campbellbacteria bacterium RIFCSPHIGHO2_12_FULL_35_10]OGD70738.1 MAG: hypothetical protein A3I18_02485 [Candidatus Campbellbacteria bacterium RIFCSPLOWO2_02_FULL_35_11]
MNNNEEHFEISIHTSIIAVVIVVVVISASSVLGYLGYKDVALENNDVKNQLVEQKKELDAIKHELNVLRFESTGQVDELNKKLTQEESIRQAMEYQLDEQGTLTENLKSKIFGVNLSSDLSSVVKKWELIIASITCDFGLANSHLKYTMTGSGIALDFPDTAIKIITNSHVVKGQNLYQLTGCAVKFTGSSTTFSISPKDIDVSADNYDWAILTINNPDSNLENVTKVFPKICDQQPSLGDSVIVLGYPDIGSKTSVTVTDGIISGFDGDYFITSAKVEQGNSGGAAILSESNCLLGIPTYASLGQVESLARILDIWTVLTR